MRSIPIFIFVERKTLSFESIGSIRWCNLSKNLPFNKAVQVEENPRRRGRKNGVTNAIVLSLQDFELGCLSVCFVIYRYGLYTEAVAGTRSLDVVFFGL